MGNWFMARRRGDRGDKPSMLVGIRALRPSGLVSARSLAGTSRVSARGSRMMLSPIAPRPPDAIALPRGEQLLGMIRGNLFPGGTIHLGYLQTGQETAHAVANENDSSL